MLVFKHLLCSRQNVSKRDLFVFSKALGKLENTLRKQDREATDLSRTREPWFDNMIPYAPLLTLTRHICRPKTNIPAIEYFGKPKVQIKMRNTDSSVQMEDAFGRYGIELHVKMMTYTIYIQQQGQKMN